MTFGLILMVKVVSDEFECPDKIIGRCVRAPTVLLLRVGVSEMRNK